MPIRNLDKIFKPQSIAVVGASAVDGKVGNTVLQNLVEGGFAGGLHPVNPHCSEIRNLRTYATVKELPQSIDLAVICTPADSVPQIVRECGQAGIMGLIILSAGFREMNAHGAMLEQAIATESRNYKGMRIIGPNCLGVISPLANLNASFANAMPTAGRVAFISQSGALCTAVLDWARQESIGFSHFVSIGNTLDIGMADLIDYFAIDQSTDAIVMYVESINDARGFMSAARAFSRNKPIIAYKAGRFAESAHAAASHTGAMAGVDAVYEAAFARAGIIRVFDVEDMFDCAELLAKHKSIGGSRLAIVTNAGGPGVMATDALLESKGTLAQLSNASIQKLNEQLPPSWSHGNPIDILGDATPERLGAALQTVLADSAVDAAIVVLSPQSMTNPTECAKAVIAASNHSHKNVLTAWMGGLSMHEGIDLLNNAGVPTYSAPEKAIHAFMHLAQYRRLHDVLYEMPHEVAVDINPDRNRLIGQFKMAGIEKRRILTECESKSLIESYGIPTTQVVNVRTAKDAVECAHQIGFPIVMKVVSPDITHKTDVEGVELNLPTAEAVFEAFERIRLRVHKHRPDARFEGVSLQQLASDVGGRELIVGAMRDPIFGAVMLVGAGGITSELVHDRALELPPLNETLARRMLESLRIWPLLHGYRGRPGVNIDQLVETLIRASYLIADNPEVSELDINPLLVSPTRVVALDARVILDLDSITNPKRPYSHLAIRPYPSEFIKRVDAKDMTSVLLRPIKPEDETRWLELIKCCSNETLLSRFKCLFMTASHETASRFCFLDYDRELAIVAEMINSQGQSQLIGIGHLVADVDHREAEYTVLIGDPWQGKGLGSLLTDHCLDICKGWRIHSVSAETLSSNNRMLHILKRRGFHFERLDDVVVALKDIGNSVS